MLRLVTRRMVAKIFLALGLAVGVALLVQARVDAERTADTLQKGTRESAGQVAQLIVGGIEHAMLDGDGIKVQSLVDELKGRLDSRARVHIYDQRGIEVFAPKPPPPEEVPAPLAATLRDRVVSRAADGAFIHPVANEDRCVKCHKKQDAGARFPGVRGALEIAVAPRACAIRNRVVPDLVHHGFVHVMTARQTDLVPDYFGALASMPGIRAVTVYDRDGDPAFGDGIEGLDPAEVGAMLTAGEPRERDAGSVHLLPLVMEDRCVECHDEDLGVVRGVMAVALEPGAGGECDDGELVAVVDSSLRYIMLSKLGRRIADFLDAAAATEAIDRLVLYDNDGRRYWTTDHPAPPPAIAEVLGHGTRTVAVDGSGASETITVIEPLVNDEGCQRCHGSDSDLRGAVSVGLSTAAAAAARAERMRDSYWFTGYTLTGILVILLGLVQYLVVRPVSHIGDIADRIGQGDLEAEVRRADPDGDEIKRLGMRINEMVRGLRAKTKLEKFVSRGAAEAANDTKLDLVRSGTRRVVTVVFSDIRGFTSYSEDRDPHDVVDMLNRLLEAQAEVVAEHGGDIDKYVGDELMAVFYGDDAPERAIECAVGLVEAVHRARKSDLEVGVGVHCGEVVYGAIGHHERMDFTVIGDAVNTGARLCSAAAPGEVMVSADIAEACAGVDGVSFEELEPLALKGKKKPIPVFRARRRQ